MVNDECVSVDFNEVDRVGAGEQVAVAEARITRKTEVGERVGVEVLLQEAAGCAGVAAGAHVVGAGAGVVAFAGVPVGVDVGVEAGGELGEGAVGSAVAGVAVGGFDRVGLVDQEGDGAVVVVQVGVAAAAVGEGEPLPERVVGVLAGRVCRAGERLG
jgi:hypothetical protein